MKHWRVDDRVSSVMIDVNRQLYMDEDTGRKTDAFGAVQNLSAEAEQWAAMWVQTKDP